MVASRDINTHSINANGRVCTLIDICTVSSTPVQLVADVAFTSEEAGNIPAAPVDTDASEGAFVYVLAGLPVGSGDKAHVAFAAETSGHIQAVAAFTQVAVLRTLVAV